MFPPLPIFEELLTRVEVEWRGQRRLVTARLKEWNSPQQTFVTCFFEDEPSYGQWVIVDWDKRLHLISTDSILKIRCEVISATKRQFSRVLTQKTVNRIGRLVRNSVTGSGIHAARLFDFPELPHEPRRVVLVGSNAVWRWEGSASRYRNRATPFRAPFSDFDVTEKQGRELLLNQWNEAQSETRFAWEWPQWNEEERKLLCCGLGSDLQELEQVMAWVLTCSQKLWETGTHWSWTLHPALASRGYVTNFSDAGRHLVLSLGVWQKVLFAHFAPEWQTDWLEQHECVRDFWKYHPLAEIRINEAPTMHEQLEARLRLREWLQGKASADEIEELLGEEK